MATSTPKRRQPTLRRDWGELAPALAVGLVAGTGIGLVVSGTAAGAGATLFAGVLAAGGTYRTVRVTRDGQITDRFTKAVEQLAARRPTDQPGQVLQPDEVLVLGGIYALERIAHDSRNDHPQVMEVLTAYVRQRAPCRNDAAEEHDPPAARDELPELPNDVQAVLAVFKRRDAQQDPLALDLRSTALARGKLPNADLRNAIFVEADLRGADLQGADLQGADLRRAKLRHALLQEANLKGATWEGAQFAGAHYDTATKWPTKDFLPEDHNCVHERRRPQSTPQRRPRRALSRLIRHEKIADPITLIVSAIAVGAATGLKATAAQEVKDAYTVLERLIGRRDRSIDVSSIERRPESEAKRASLHEDMAEAGAGDDREMLQAARRVIAEARQHDADVGTALGIDLKQVEAELLRVCGVESSGTGTPARQGTSSGDIDHDIQDVHAGRGAEPDRPPH